MSIPENFVAPGLPVASEKYDASLQEQFRNVLRMYFNRLDNYNQVTNEQDAATQTLTWLNM